MAKTKKRRRIVLIVILLLIIAIIPAYFLLENYLENRVRNQLTNELLPGHNVQVAKVELDLLWGDLLIDSISVHFEEGARSRNKFRIRETMIPALEIKGIKILKLLLSDELKIGGIALNNPDISIEIPDKETEAETDKKKSDLPFREVLLKNLSIERMQFEMISPDDGKRLMAFDSMDFEAGHFKLSLKDSLSFELPEFKRLRLLNFQSVVNDPFYDLNIAQLYLHEDSNLVAREIELIPGFDKYTFARELGHQTDRADILLDSVFIGGIDYAKFPEGDYHCRIISINGLQAELLRDKRVPRPEGYVPPLPQQALRKLGPKVKIDSLQTNNAVIHYYERVPGSNRPGHVFFNRLNLLFLNINNDPEHFGVRNMINCYATGALMGESLARVRVWFPVISASDTMFFEGNLENFKLDNLNEITTPNEQVKIDDGYLNKLEFEARANHSFSSGELVFLYDDLKVSVLRDDEALLKEQTIFSFIVNRVLRSNNPVGKRDPLIASMYFERDMEKSALNFLWKSIFSGVKATVTPGKQNLERGKEKDYFKR